MKLDTISREDLFSSTFSVEHFKVEGENIERLWKYFESYHLNRLKENYSRKAFDSLIEENRFNYGAMALYKNDEVIAVTGLCDHENWIIFTRMIFFKLMFLPLTTAYLMPELIKIAEQDGKDGIAATFNSNTLSTRFTGFLTNTHEEKYKERAKKRTWYKDLEDHELWSKAAEIKSGFKKLDYTVEYRNTEQDVVYYPFHDMKPPFKHYE